MIIPQFVTIKEAARLGPLSEYTLRQLIRQKRVPCIYSGRKCLINYNKYINMLNALNGDSISCQRGD